MPDDQRHQFHNWTYAKCLRFTVLNLITINRDLKLIIDVVDGTLAYPYPTVPGMSNIVWYVSRNVFFEYFNYISITGITICPAADWNYKYSWL